MNENKWSYEIVEYSDGVYITVFDPMGIARHEVTSEEKAKHIVSRENNRIALGEMES